MLNCLGMPSVKLCVLHKVSQSFLFSEDLHARCVVRKQGDLVPRLVDLEVFDEPLVLGLADLCVASDAPQMID